MRRETIVVRDLTASTGSVSEICSAAPRPNIAVTRGNLSPARCCLLTRATIYLPHKAWRKENKPWFLNSRHGSDPSFWVRNVNFPQKISDTKAISFGDQLGSVAQSCLRWSQRCRTICVFCFWSHGPALFLVCSIFQGGFAIT
jgi:hypothetical protein